MRKSEQQAAGGRPARARGTTHCCREWGSEKEGAGSLIPSVLGDGPRAVTLNGAVVLAAADLEPALLTPVHTHARRGS